MKLFAALLIAALVTHTLAATPEFDGVMASRGTTYFAMREAPTQGTRWIKLGDRIGSYRVSSYDQPKETLSLTSDEGETLVVLKPGAVRAAPTVQLLQTLVTNGDDIQTYVLRALRELEQRRDQTAATLVEWEARALKQPSAKSNDMVVNLRRKLELEEANLAYYIEKMLEASRNELRGSK